MKNFWQSSTIFAELVQNNFIIERLTVNCRERLSRTKIWQASVPYNSTGRHLAWIKLMTTSSEAKRTMLLNIALNDRKKWLLAWSKQHLNMRPLTKYTPKYLQLLFQSTTPPKEEARLLHSEACSKTYTLLLLLLLLLPIQYLGMGYGVWRSPVSLLTWTSNNGNLIS